MLFFNKEKKKFKNFNHTIISSTNFYEIYSDLLLLILNY